MTDRPLVVKVGGSLYAHAGTIVPVLRSGPRPLLVVPGGGPFADTVRKVNPGNDAAHWMAIAAMDLYGWVLASHGIPTTERLAFPEVSTVLLPYSFLRERDPLPHSWDVTSDTIAAWVAGELDADLLVLKSVDGIFCNGTFQKRVCEPVECEEVDPNFLPFVLEHRIETFVMNGTETESITQSLAGKNVRGTRISARTCTTF